MQCCYKKDLSLLKWDPATGLDPSAGTPDRYSPATKWTTILHYYHDVLPWCYANDLKRLPEYMAQRPPSNGGGKSCDSLAIPVPVKLQTWMTRFSVEPF